MNTNTEIRRMSTNTKNGDCYIYTMDDKRRTLVIIDNMYGFLSSNKILNKTRHISPIGKPTKYFNEFNEDDQKAIKEWINN